MFYFKAVLLLTCLTLSYGKLDYYCKICKEHTMCLYNDLGKDCKEAGGSGITRKEKQEILDVHNWVRRIVAGGYEKRGVGGSQPKASNMMKLEWDDELMKVAQQWADQCRFEHDTCRDDPRWKVGQNIYWKWRYPTHTVNWTEAIITWYDEVSLFDPNTVGSYRHEAATGHYTQLMWHDTYKIGCGRRDYGANKLYVCNYGPAGNWLEESMYSIGDSCSKCPAGTHCDEHLCANFHAGEQPKEGGSRKNMPDSKTVTDGPPTTKPPPRKSTNSQDAKNRDVFTLLQALLKERSPPKAQTSENHRKSENPNPVKENDVEFDLETKNAIEEIKIKIQNLVKKVIKKCKSQ